LVSPIVLSHHLALGDVRVAVELAVESSALVDLEVWRHEADLRRSPIKVDDPHGGVIVPDGMFGLRLDGHAVQHFFVELDRGTNRVPDRMRLKLGLYLQHARQQPHPQPVLWIVPTETRATDLAAWANEEGQKLGADPTVFCIAIQDTITPQSILFRPIWRVVTGPCISLIPPSAAPRTAVPSQSPSAYS
jgi:hypothetical protein